LTNENIKIYFYGDSICAGQKFPVHRGWVCKISQKLEEQNPKKKIVVSNFSINGRTTRQALETMPYHIQSDPPKIIIIQFGMNDCNYWETDKGHPRISKESFRANLSEMIARSKLFGIEKIIINTNHPANIDEIIPFTNISYQQSNEQYNEIIREVAKEERVILIDMEKNFLNRMKKNDTDRKDYLLKDFIHLGDLGHKLYFEVVHPILEKLL